MWGHSNVEQFWGAIWWFPYRRLKFLELKAIVVNQLLRLLCQCDGTVLVIGLYEVKVGKLSEALNENF